MHPFPTPQIIPIPKNLIVKATTFAEQVIPTINYRDSNQSNRKKIQNDHFVSKLGEEAVRLAFEQFGLIVKGPDYEIYQGKNKSWEEDLLVDDVALAVKTQKKSAALRYGLSWTFQSSGFRNDPILKTPHAWVCFVECDDTRNYECKVYPPMQIKDLTFRDPKLAHLKGKKQVVYARDF